MKLVRSEASTQSLFYFSRSNNNSKPRNKNEFAFGSVKMFKPKVLRSDTFTTLLDCFSLFAAHLNPRDNYLRDGILSRRAEQSRILAYSISNYNLHWTRRKPFVLLWFITLVLQLTSFSAVDGNIPQSTQQAKTYDEECADRNNSP